MSHQRREEHEEQEEIRLLRRILAELKEIAGLLKPAKAVSAKLTITPQ